MFGHQDDNQDQNNGFTPQLLEPPNNDASDSANPVNSDPPSDTSNNTSYLDSLASEPKPNDRPSDNESTSSSGGDLLDIKKQALEELSPLVSHLDQTPEEKFKTTMMMIQGADNQSLIPEAYKAAKSISDDKSKAQALLDIVNEINYFTHKN